jgi:tRNA threonylcarbamoyladenosine biosynthesis protein TsaB
MTYILHLETATKICSVAIAKDGVLISHKETTVANSHSSLITSFVADVVKAAGIELNDLSAVCISMGPGSYTGLRIGVSTAKGFCYALNIPLIAVNTLQSMANYYAANNADKLNDETLLCPMIDARRMEVFTALFNKDITFIKETSAKIIDEESFQKELSAYKIIFFGDGAEKCRQSLSHNPNAIINTEFTVSSRGMISIAWKKYLAKNFENLAYFEPYYLKDFLATIPRKMI